MDKYIIKIDEHLTSFKSISDAKKHKSLIIETSVKVENVNMVVNTTTNTIVPIICFTDGSTFGNNGPSHLRKAGYSCIFPDYIDKSVAYELKGDKTNNRSEIMAVIEAFIISHEIDPTNRRHLIVHTDSELVVNSITKWMSGWKRRGWIKSDGKPVMNKDLLKILDEHMQIRNIIVKHVRAHTGKNDYASHWNNVADKLARDVASKR